MKDFNLPSLETIEKDGKRLYITPEGTFPSVTTVLGVEAKEGIEKWKKRIGEEKAEFLKKRAADRGNVIHAMMEDYLRGNPVNPPNVFFKSLYLKLKSHLDEYMKETWCVEVPLYSSQLRVAGRTDLIGVFEEPEIVDFKGATNEKKEEYIKGYRMQVCAYARMMKERTGINIRKYRILIVDEFGTLQVFQGNTSDQLLDFARARKKFHEIHGI